MVTTFHRLPKFWRKRLKRLNKGHLRFFDFERSIVLLPHQLSPHRNFRLIILLLKTVNKQEPPSGTNICSDYLSEDIICSSKLTGFEENCEL